MTATHLERRKQSTQTRITQLVSGKSVQACQELAGVGPPLGCAAFGVLPFSHLKNDTKGKTADL